MGTNPSSLGRWRPYYVGFVSALLANYCFHSCTAHGSTRNEQEGAQAISVTVERPVHYVKDYVYVKDCVGGRESERGYAQRQEGDEFLDNIPSVETLQNQNTSNVDGNLSLFRQKGY